ncbi:serine/threonine protein phosphatase [Arthrobacter sulfonylureivorans]|uniref:serine/threonine protein phosphatase n=1 Tax=Arthrobacter sulfonylureivorans TaxID=2486855 RepID=UPI0039E3DE4B
MATPLPSENTFDHVRALDGEHVGYIHMTDDGGFVPFDLLHRQRGEVSELDEAEALLDELGLRLLAEDWWLDLDGERVKVLIREVRRATVSVSPALTGPIAKSIDLTKTIELLLPTDRLHQAG